jgi:hypothetical protein
MDRTLEIRPLSERDIENNRRVLARSGSTPGFSPTGLFVLETARREHQLADVPLPEGTSQPRWWAEKLLHFDPPPPKIDHRRKTDEFYNSLKVVEGRLMIVHEQGETEIAPSELRAVGTFPVGTVYPNGFILDKPLYPFKLGDRNKVYRAEEFDEVLARATEGDKPEGLEARTTWVRVDPRLAGRKLTVITFAAELAYTPHATWNRDAVALDLSDPKNRRMIEREVQRPLHTSNVS